jgi:acetyl esterase/lipase
VPSRTETERPPAETGPGEAAGIPAALGAWLKKLNEVKQELERQGYVRTPIVVREAFEYLTRSFVSDRPAVERIVDDVIPGPDYAVPVRVYHPQPTESLPVAVFVHGGGHVAGSVSVYEPLARKLAIATRHVVVAVEYRLAPECPYPAGLKDVIAVVKGLQHLLEERRCAFEARVSLVGDSAGGALCATAAHLLRYEPAIEIESQVLIYPSLDYTLSMPSVQAFCDGYLLERDRIIWYFDQYFQNAEDRSEKSPLFMACSDTLPRTLLLTAEYCPLRDEGAAYAERLQQAGVAVEHEVCAGMIHAFLNLEDLVPEQCAGVYQRIADFLARGTR